MEQTLNIVENGQYKNINLKTRIDKSTNQAVNGIAVGNYVIVEKARFDTALEIPKGKYSLYRCTAAYMDEEVSFFLNRSDEAEAWNGCGGVGDRVKISAESIGYKHEGKDKTRVGLVFELLN